MSALRIHIMYLVLFLVAHQGYGQREISVDEMPEAFFGNWRDRDGGTVWRLETKREYIGSNNYVWYYRRITEKDGVYEVEVEYAPPSRDASAPRGGSWRRSDPGVGNSTRFTFRDIAPGSMHIHDRYQGRRYDAVPKRETSKFRKLSPAELPEKYMGTWIGGENAYTEEMVVDRKAVRINGKEWRYFEIMQDYNWLRIVLQRGDQFQIWVPKMSNVDKLSSIFYPYTHLRRQRPGEESLNANRKVLGVSDLPKAIFGNWQDASQVWQYQIKPTYFGVDNEVWTYQRITTFGEGYTIEVKNPAGNIKQYTFWVQEDGRLKVADPYRGYEFQLRPKPFDRNFFRVSLADIPERYIGRWVTRDGSEEVYVNREEIWVNNRKWEYDEVLVYASEYRFMLNRNGRYLLWIPKSKSSDQISGVLNRRNKLNLIDRNTRFPPGSRSNSPAPEIEDNLSPDTTPGSGNRIKQETDSFRGEGTFGLEASPPDFSPDTGSSFSANASPISATLPNAMFRNWNSRNGEWVFDIQQTHLGLAGTAWHYERTEAAAEDAWLVDISWQDQEGGPVVRQQLSLRLITDVWMEVIQEGVRYEVLAMPFNNSFYLVHANDLPQELLDDWYHTSGEDSLSLQIRRDSLEWRGQTLSYEQIIRKNEAYYLTCQANNRYLIFRLEQMENGFLQVVLEEQTYLFNRQPILPSLGRILLFGLLALLLIGGLTWLFFRWRTQVLQRREIIKRREIELELKALRSQMNPHFLFNSLNSIQNLINKQDPDQANHYLSRFSSLMRKVLNNTESPFITLEEEIAILNLYCELEALRFNFNYSIEVAPELDIYNTEIPGMLVQPFVENAIRHGIGPADSHGELRIDFREQDGLLRCMVQDNGIGIKASLARKKIPVDERGGSFGIRLAEERLQMIHTHYGDQLRIDIRDRSEEASDMTGTEILIYLPTNLA